MLNINKKIDRLFKYYQTKAAILHLPVGEMMIAQKKKKQKPKEEITMSCYNVMVLDVKYKQMHYFHLVCGTLSSNLATIRLLWALLSYCWRLFHHIMNSVDLHKMEVLMKGRFEMLMGRLK